MPSVNQMDFQNVCHLMMKYQMTLIKFGNSLNHILYSNNTTNLSNTLDYIPNHNYEIVISESDFECVLFTLKAIKN